MEDPILVAANFIYLKQFEKAIHLLDSLRDGQISRTDSGMKHLHLGIAHGKLKNVPKSDFHYRKAMEYGHPTGLAFEKLAISLTKQGRIKEAIQVCDALISHPSIPKPRSAYTKDDFRKRKLKLLAALAKTGDSPDAPADPAPTQAPKDETAPSTSIWKSIGQRFGLTSKQEDT